MVCGCTSLPGQVANTRMHVSFKCLCCLGRLLYPWVTSGKFTCLFFKGIYYSLVITA